MLFFHYKINEDRGCSNAFEVVFLRKKLLYTLIILKKLNQKHYATTDSQAVIFFKFKSINYF